MLTISSIVSGANKSKSTKKKQTIGEKIGFSNLMHVKESKEINETQTIDSPTNFTSFQETSDDDLCYSSGFSILSVLNKIRFMLIDGSTAELEYILNNLSNALEENKLNFHDSNLQDVLNEILLRAEVEKAKLIKLKKNFS